MSEEVKTEEVEIKPEYIQNLDMLPKLSHNFVERGAKVSCEGAGHPHHSHYKIKRGSL